MIEDQNKIFNLSSTINKLNDTILLNNQSCSDNAITREKYYANKLMEQQLMLADAMKNMGPLIDSAKALMQGFDFNNLDNIASMAKKFIPSK